MMQDKIDFVDYDYENCTQEKPSRLIKTKKSSFSAIKNAFREIRLFSLTTKLETMKDKALKASYAGPNFEEKIEKKVTAIAKVEEKIMVLRKEDVPTDYVKRRAIKLKQKMCDNLSWNAQKFYSVGPEKFDEVFDNDSEIFDDDIPKVEEEFSPPVEENDFVQPVVESVEGLSNGEIKEVVNSELDALEEAQIISSVDVAEEAADEPQLISKEEIKESINEALDASKNEVQPVMKEPSISHEEIANVVNEALDASKKEAPVVEESSLSHEEIADAVNEALDASKKEVPVVEESSLSHEEISDAVNESFAELGGKEIPEGDAILPSQDIRAAIDESFAELGSDKDKDSPQLDIENTLPREEVINTINAAFDEADLKEQQTSVPVVSDVDSPVDVFDHKNYQDSGLSTTEIEAAINEVIDRMKVSKNETSLVKFDKFNEDGTKRNEGDEMKVEFSPSVVGGDIPKRNPVYNYTPMTDEEIRASQAKLGFDEHGNLVNPPMPKYDKVATANIVGSGYYVPESSSQLRDTPVVAPERNYNERNNERIEEFTFDAPAVNQAVQGTNSSNSSKLDDYNALKRKIELLREEHAKSQLIKEAAQREAEKAALEAQRAKEEYDASQKHVDQSIQMLRQYSEALEEDCHRNERTAESAQNDARVSQDFVNEQRSKVDANRRIIEEIESLIGPQATTQEIAIRSK